MPIKTHTHALRFCAAILVVGVVSPTATAATCLRKALTYRLLTPEQGTIAKDGGIVVSLLYETEDLATLMGPPPTVERPSWRISVGQKAVSPKIRAIAPGLEVYDVGDSSGDIVLEDSDGRELLHAQRGDVAALDAPKVKRIWSTKQKFYGTSRVETVAEFSAAAPATALAVVVYHKDGVTPRSWGRLNAEAKSSVIYLSNLCPEQHPDSKLLRAGDVVRVAWLDNSGRLSKLSGPIKIIRKR